MSCIMCHMSQVIFLRRRTKANSKEKLDKLEELERPQDVKELTEPKNKIEKWKSVNLNKHEN